MRSPVRIVLVPKPVPVTAGTPYSRHTIAAWLIMPPMSVTHAVILGNTGAQLGAVIGATRISPSSRSPTSSGENTSRATPSATPGEAAMPVMAPSSSPVPSHDATDSLVMPHSMIVNGSVITSGGSPSALGACQADSLAWMSRRLAMVGAQCEALIVGAFTAQLA